ncbi:MAG: hypothetical protein HC893_00050 [Chloroflexaceae bacterium]|nr:hypothetical protein [Chloroflexaceae bacterium]
MLTSLLALAIGLWLGLSLADFDQVLFFLRHRSAITHSALIPALALLFASRQNWLRMGLIGAFIGMAVHLSFDLFPLSWSGYALINVPLFGYLDATLSMLWISLNITICFYLALLLFEEGYEVLSASIGLGVAFLLYAPGETVFWSALFALTVTLGFALLLPGSKASAVQMVKGRLKV